MSVITIARQFGAGGKTLGRWVAEKLGYELIDEELVEMVAKEANVSTEMADSVAEEAGNEGVFARMMSKLGPYRKGYVEVAMEKSPGYLDGNLYISLLHKVIPKVASQDNVVIVGRGAQYVLGDRQDTYHFLMLADMEYRIDFMMKYYKLDRKQAQIVVEKQSKRRLNLYRYFGRTDFDQPNLYHMIFNMNRVELEEAVQAVYQLVAGKTSS